VTEPAASIATAAASGVVAALLASLGLEWGDFGCTVLGGVLVTEA
jgi:hypothetical protein